MNHATLVALAVVLVACGSPEAAPAPVASCPVCPSAEPPQVPPLGDAERTFDELHAKACAGDAVGFFAMLDEDAMTRAYGEDALRRIMADDTKAKAWLGFDAATREATLKERAAAVMGEAFNDWRKEIAKKDAGDLCKWERLGTARNDIVVIRRGSGLTAKITLQRGKVVRYHGDDEP